jgi:uncharacterized protein YhdP
LRIERRAEGQADEDRIDVTYGRVAQVAAHRKLGKGDVTVDRLLLSLGRAAERPDAARPERPGTWVRAELPSLSVDEWLALRERPADTGSGTADPIPPLGGIDLDVAALDVFGRHFNELKVVARRSQSDWKLELRGREIVGTAAWSSAGSGTPNGSIVARLARLALPAGSEPVPKGTGEKGGESRPGGSAANPWPDIDIAADSFSSKGRDLGKLELISASARTEWLIELALANERPHRRQRCVARQRRRQQTKLDVALDAKDAADFSRFGHGDTLQGAPTKINGQLGWSGTPANSTFRR